MPTIIVVPETTADEAPAFRFSERVSAVHMRDEHFRAQLIERIEWAVADAEQDEGQPPEH